MNNNLNNQYEQNVVQPQPTPSPQNNSNTQTNPYITQSNNNYINNGNYNQKPQAKHFISLILALLNYFVVSKFVVAIGLISTIVSKSSFGFYFKLILIFLYLIGTIAWIFIAGWKVCKYNKISKIIYLIVAIGLAIMLGKSIYDGIHNKQTTKSNTTNTTKENTLNQELEMSKFKSDVAQGIRAAESEWLMDDLKNIKTNCYILFDENKDHDYSYECKKIENIENTNIRYAAIFDDNGKLKMFTAVNRSFFVEIKLDDITPYNIRDEYYRINHSINGMIVSKKDNEFIIDLDNQLSREVNK